MNNEINVCFATDENYIDLTIMAIYSIIKVTKSPLHFFILGDNADVEIFKKFEICPNVKVTTYSEDLSKLISNRETSRYITRTTYFRLLIPDLPIFESVNKVLYLDQDIIARKDISEYYNQDLGRACLGVVKDFGSAFVYNKHPVRINMYKYFYAGQLLMNLPELRREKFTKRCLTLLRRTKFNDMKIINHVCVGKVKYLDPKYCFSWHKLFLVGGNYCKIDLWNKLYGTDYESIEALEDASVIWHFHGDKKQMVEQSEVIRDLFKQYLDEANIFLCT